MEELESPKNLKLLLRALAKANIKSTWKTIIKSLNEKINRIKAKDNMMNEKKCFSLGNQRVPPSFFSKMDGKKSLHCD